VYLDYNASTPIDPRVLEAMLPYLTQHYGNPSSVHQYGRQSRAGIETAREQVAALVAAHPSQLIFTSGGTEANNLAIKGCLAYETPGTIVTSAIEHASVRQVAQEMTKRTWQHQELGVDQSGCIDLVQLESLNDDVRFVSVMIANNETGVVQDIRPISQWTRDQGAIMHTDAVQAAGKIPVNFKESGVHLLTLSSHKIYGPKGIGALIIDKAIEVEPMLCGGGHEKGLRSGTENLAAIVGFGVAAELAISELAARTEKLEALKIYLEKQLLAIPGLSIFSDQVTRVANTVLMAYAGIDGEALLLQLDKKGFAVSSGSACSSGHTEPSHVLVAMQADEALARSATRISLGKDNTESDIDAFVLALNAILSCK